MMQSCSRRTQALALHCLRDDPYDLEDQRAWATSWRARCGPTLTIFLFDHKKKTRKKNLRWDATHELRRDARSPKIVMGNSTFSNADIVASRLKVWNTKPVAQKTSTHERHHKNEKKKTKTKQKKNTQNTHNRHEPIFARRNFDR